jgi:hypothetical protein
VWCCGAHRVFARNPAGTLVCAFMLLLTLLIFCFGVRENRRVARSVRSEGELRDVRTDIDSRLYINIICICPAHTRPRFDVCNLTLANCRNTKRTARTLRRWNDVGTTHRFLVSPAYRAYFHQLACRAVPSNSQNQIELTARVTCRRVVLRTRWLFGSSVYPIRGDPWLHSQRMFLVFTQVLVMLSLTSIFYSAAV